MIQLFASAVLLLHVVSCQEDTPDAEVTDCTDSGCFAGGAGGAGTNAAPAGSDEANGAENSQTTAEDPTTEASTTSDTDPQPPPDDDADQVDGAEPEPSGDGGTGGTSNVDDDPPPDTDPNQEPDAGIGGTGADSDGDGGSGGGAQEPTPPIDPDNPCAACTYAQTCVSPNADCAHAYCADIQRGCTGCNCIPDPPEDGSPWRAGLCGTAPDGTTVRVAWECGFPTSGECLFCQYLPPGPG